MTHRSNLGNLLLGYVFELRWSTSEILPDRGSKFDYRDEISDTESEAHFGICYTLAVTI